ncbi:TatD family hydrolase, partial [Exiguobacterium sp.]
MLIDTHTHLNADQFADDVHETIERARANGVSPMIVVGFDHKTIDRAMELVEAYDDLYAVIGWHPVDSIDFDEEAYQKVE